MAKKGNGIFSVRFTEAGYLELTFWDNLFGRFSKTAIAVHLDPQKRNILVSILGLKPKIRDFEKFLASDHPLAAEVAMKIEQTYHYD